MKKKNYTKTYIRAPKYIFFENHANSLLRISRVANDRYGRTLYQIKDN